MQVLIEGLALAAFGLLRDMTDKPLPKQILAYVMQDEARHVAFGRLALRDYYAELSSKEKEEREDFVVEGCYLMRDRFRQQEVWANLGFDVEESMRSVENSQYFKLFQSLLFSRIAPVRQGHRAVRARRCRTPSPTWACSTWPGSTSPR
jgi:ribonucleotide reductase beta subunit family protein with ferritin-like domain